MRGPVMPNRVIDVTLPDIQGFSKRELPAHPADGAYRFAAVVSIHCIGTECDQRPVDSVRDRGNGYVRDLCFVIANKGSRNIDRGNDALGRIGENFGRQQTRKRTRYPMFQGRHDSITFVWGVPRVDGLAVKKPTGR